MKQGKIEFSIKFTSPFITYFAQMICSPRQVILFKTTFALLVLLIAFSKSAFAQERVDTPLQYIVKYTEPAIRKPFPVTGRLVGMKLELLKAAAVVNICTGETVKTDDDGIYHINAARGDTLGFSYASYTPEVFGIKAGKDKVNIVLFKRKAGNLPAPYTRSEYERAAREDEEMYRILDKDAKLEGRWTY